MSSSFLVGFIKQDVQETFIRFEFSLIACYKKTRLHFNFFFNLLIPISFQPDGLNLVYFNINGLWHRVAKIYQMKIRVFGINSFSLNLKWKTISLYSFNHQSNLLHWYIRDVLKCFDWQNHCYTFEIKTQPS